MYSQWPPAETPWKHNNSLIVKALRFRPCQGIEKTQLLRYVQLLSDQESVFRLNHSRLSVLQPQDHKLSLQFALRVNRLLLTRTFGQSISPSVQHSHQKVGNTMPSAGLTFQHWSKYRFLRIFGAESDARGQLFGQHLHSFPGEESFCRDCRPIPRPGYGQL